ncbi:hypothetical protein GCM10008939_21370 [Deinococcus aquiradiocola]|uniref:Uncharacterized protein n=1 Tax=Deinococcus aquiradiocola TaxID=393059 RepID=A0A917PGL0_9DEIO|nr:hypothetical protein GCM10008939_21370 [Deinococcus aquiradiocola]
MRDHLMAQGLLQRCRAQVLAQRVVRGKLAIHVSFEVQMTHFGKRVQGESARVGHQA